jgi:hypothetical protein
MFKEKVKISDSIKIGVSQKSPEKIAKIQNGDPCIDELKRRRRQTPQKWYPIAGNPDEMFDGIWPNLSQGTWLRLVYSNGNLLTGKVKGVSGDGEIELEQNTILLNHSLCNKYILCMSEAEIIQAFVDSEAEALRIRSLHGGKEKAEQADAS